MSKIFLGGVPTAPDVRSLRDHFKLTPGDEVDHEQVAAVISCRVGTARYRTVTCAWRRAMLNDENVEIAAVPGAGFRCLTPEERVDYNVKTFQSGTRKQARSLRRVATVRRSDLTEATARKLDHLNLFGARIIESATSMIREMGPPPKQQQLPRVNPAQ